jgi:hypothetical protein
MSLGRLSTPVPTQRSSERALNSAVECHLHTVEVAGSNPAAPTSPINDLRGVVSRPVRIGGHSVATGSPAGHPKSRPAKPVKPICPRLEGLPAVGQVVGPGRTGW